MIENDFNKFAEEHTKSLCDHIDNLVEFQNRPREYVMSSHVNNDETGEIIEGSRRWAPIGKSISNLYRYAEVSKANNMRYINALPMPVDINTPVKEIEKISKGIEVNERHISCLMF